MSLLPYYSTGTITVTNGSTAFAGTGVDWVLNGLLPGDKLWIPGYAPYYIDAIGADSGDLLAPWADETLDDVPYFIFRDGLGRFDPLYRAEQVRDFNARIGNAIVYAVAGAAPDPGIGTDGSLAYKITGSSLAFWSKEAGEWGAPLSLTFPYADGASILDSNTNELLTFGVTAAAVNQFKVTNAATGNAPLLSVIGGDTNIPARYATKGTGEHIWQVNAIDELKLSGAALYPASSGGLDIGTSGNPFDKGFFSGALSAASVTVSGSSVPTNGIYLHGANQVGIATNGSLSFFVTAGGAVIKGSTAVQVGISATTPGFQIHGTALSNSSFANFRWDDGSGAAANYFYKSRGGSVGTHGAVTNGTALGDQVFAGSDGAAFLYGARLMVLVDGAPGTNSMPARFEFRTTPSGSDTPVNRLSIGNAGQVAMVANITANSTTSGTLVVTGGLGASGAGYFGGLISAATFEPSGSSSPTNGIYLPSSNRLGFATNGSMSMSIESNANVGMGGSFTPVMITTNYRGIHYHSSNANWCLHFTNTTTGTTTAGGFFIYQAGDGAVSFRQVHANSIVFMTSDTTRWQIDLNGHLRPQVTNSVDIGTSSLRVKQIYSNNALDTSDRRAKDIIADMRDVLSRAMSLRVMEYDRYESASIIDGALKLGSDKRRQFGVVAQDARELFPEIVFGDESKELLSVTESKIGVIALAGLQEHVTKTDREIALLKARIAQLESRSVH